MKRLALLLNCFLAWPLLAQSALDVLVIAPHPDDEVIGCAGLILQTLEKGQHAGVVILTHGDGYPALAAVVGKKANGEVTPDDFLQAGALRQRHSIQAMARLGLPAGDLIFLGYPDAGLEKIYLGEGDSPFRQMFTRKDATYGLAKPDYRSQVHGKPAPYLKASVVADLVEIIQARRPKAVFVTDETDTHGDHRAAFRFVRDALRAAKYEGESFTYVVHGSPLAAPPARKVVLTAAQLETKRAALIDHQQGTSPIHDRLDEEYAKPEEWFWRFNPSP